MTRILITGSNSGFGRLAARREEGGEIVISEERAQLIPHYEVQVPTRKGDPGDACRLLGDGWNRLRVQ